MSLLRITGILACDPTGIIGVDNRLPWAYPEELAHFYQTIQDKPLIMGYNTYLHAPLRLKERPETIVFSSHHPHEKWPKKIVHASSEAEFTRLYQIQPSYVESLHQRYLNEKQLEALAAAVCSNTSHFMIGGAQIAHLFLKNKWLNAFILTHIKKPYPGNVRLDLSYLKTWQSLTLRDTPEFRIMAYVS